MPRPIDPRIFTFSPLFLALSLAFCLLPAQVPAAAGAELRPTPDTGTGPFYPVDDSLDRDNDLTRVEGAAAPAEGEVLRIEGRVLDTAGEPVPGARLVIWQTDPWGNYDHPGDTGGGSKSQGGHPRDPGFQYWGKTASDGDGRYLFTTIVPGHYSVGRGRRPNHVHFRITHPGFRALATELNFRGDPNLAEDFVTGDLSPEQLALINRELLEGDGGEKRAVFDIVLRRR